MSRFSLFEISWETANKVGGIYTVVSTKARTLAERMGDDYVLVGPWLLDQQDPDALLEREPRYDRFAEACRAAGVPVHVGRWRIPGRPLTILVEFSGLYERKDAILADLWTRYRVDSLYGGWEYVEPVLFGHAAGQVVELWWREVVRGARATAVVQAHEWMTGSALLYLKPRVPEMGTVFTAHATVLGRSAAAQGKTPEEAVRDTTPARAAAELRVRARHSMESTLAREADVFTTVSEISSREAELFFGRAADPVLPNGLDPEVLTERLNGVASEEAHARLRDLACRFLGEDVGDAALVCCGARYEFRAKGLDVLLDAVAKLDSRPGRPLVLFLLVPAGNSGLRHEVARRLAAKKPPRGAPLGLCLQHLFDEDQDPIAVRCRELGLVNAPGSRVRIIHSADYVSAEDGVLNLSYEAALQGADLTVFPSFYESWGYTPQESLALGVPTVTTDRAGFGLWADSRGLGADDGVHMLRRQDRHDVVVTAELTRILETVLDGEPIGPGPCRRAAAATFWTDLVAHYDTAFESALQAADGREDEIAAPRPVLALPMRPPAQSSRPHVFELDVPTRVPAALRELEELVRNWWWTWDVAATRLFEDLCPGTFEACRRNPARLIREIAPERLNERARDKDYLRRLDEVMQRQRAYLAETPDERSVTVEHPVAYVCAEYGIHESMPIYSGGLGVLAGDHLRSASDLGVPLVAIGLLYRKGYMRQQLEGGVVQRVAADPCDPATLPLRLLRDDEGEPLEIALPLPGTKLHLRVWRADVGRVPLYLLDSDVETNLPEDRGITHALYGGDQECRIRQEIALGIGGMRLLRRLGIDPSVVHVNEGHGAFVALERMRRLLRDTELSFDEAQEVVRRTTVFTTHTPVPAGHDAFPDELVRRHFSDAPTWIGLSWEKFFELGASDESPGKFNMTGLALRFASRVNGVSKKHAEVSKGLLRDFAPHLLADEIPVHAVTNGVHLGQWTAPEIQELIGASSGDALASHFADAGRLDDAAVWDARRALRTRLVGDLRSHLQRVFRERRESPAWRRRVEDALDPDALYIGFARRFATYKRADLVFREPDRLAALLNAEGRPVRLLVAGKAHPRDKAAQELLARVGTLAREERFRGRVLLLEDYDMGLARWLVRGVDVWLNNPRRPLEASGTSGMKAAANGALNLSVGDGWWLEGFDGTNGWTIGDDGASESDAIEDALDAESLYSLLETEVVPAFFDRDERGVPPAWTALVRGALSTIPPAFDAARMVADYREWAYEPLARTHEAARAERYSGLPSSCADLIRIRRGLDEVRIVNAAVGGAEAVHAGDVLDVTVDVDLGPLTPDDVSVQLVTGKRDDDLELRGLDVIELIARGASDNGAQRFQGRLALSHPGAYGYAIRVRPSGRDSAASLLHDPVVWA